MTTDQTTRIVEELRWFADRVRDFPKTKLLFDAADLLLAQQGELEEAGRKYRLLLAAKQHSPLCSGCSGKYHSDKCVACERDAADARCAVLEGALKDS